MAEPEIMAFLSHPAVEDNVAASTQTVALSALTNKYSSDNDEYEVTQKWFSDGDEEVWGIARRYLRREDYCPQ